MYEKNNYETAQLFIENIFNDNREIVGLAEEEIQQIAVKHGRDADIFKTKNDELISYEIILEDIDNEEIQKIKEYGEELFKINGKLICIYLLGSPHTKITAKKELESESPLLINISIMPQSDAYDIFRHISSMVKNKEKLDKDDLFALSMIPQMGPKEDKRHLRIECLKLWKEITKKRLIK
ncbi:MAG: hypothetical protein J6B73_09505 [Methanobrevibacter sp.]|uniref:hypothetical protein n=1 Tax=Methanobrevibacter sp. TaxID=66852 RepID=UPI001B1C9AAA|nr:hypothetical protein [Methanobrevibacter sp.]MBO5152378.1 hypothetical protein [Methanobrevibacter sp.]